MDLMKVLHQIACSICHGTEKEKPQIELLQMPSEQVLEEINALGLKLLYPTLLDFGQPYCYTTAEGWAKVFDYIYFIFNMPPYIAARMDCEDFGILLKGLVSTFFGLNYFGFILGWAPLGYHGWDLFRDSSGHLQFEPQNGEAFGLGERGYKPEYTLL